MIKQLFEYQEEQQRVDDQRIHALDQIERATRDRKLSKNALAIYVGIISAYRSGVDVLNRDQLEKITTLEKRSITRAIANLKEQGYVKTELVKHGQRFTILK